MNRKRTILTIVALIAFFVVVVLIGYGQKDSIVGGFYVNAMQIFLRFGGLTSFGTALVVLMVSYIGLFALFADREPRNKDLERRLGEAKRDLAEANHLLEKHEELQRERGGK